VSIALGGAEQKRTPLAIMPLSSNLAMWVKKSDCTLGFKVNDCEPSPYRLGEDIYIMSKHLSPLYNGDVFDLRQQAVWLLKHYYRLIDRHAEEDKQVYELRVALGPFGAEDQDNVAHLSGIAVIEEAEIAKPDQEAVRLLRESKKHLRFLFADTIASNVQRELDAHGIKAFDRAGVLDVFGKFFAYSPVAFARDQIAGMVVLFKPELFDRIEPETKSHTYFKGGPTGKYLRPGNNLLLLVEPSADDPTDGICGIASIRSVFVGSAAQVWSTYHDRNPLFTETEFARFSAKKNALVAIEFTDVRRFSPLPTEDLLEKVLRSRFDTDELGHLYVDNSSLQRLNELRPLPTPSASTAKRQYRVALSFAGEDRPQAEKLAVLLGTVGVAVFYDAHEQANLWGKNLYQHLQKVYRDDADFCVVFLSEAYRRKLWTRHELEQMQARAFKENSEYILPVKIDDTPIPGINETTGYLDLRQIKIEDVFSALLEKLRTRD
jgi:hypothetical protein